MADDPTVGEIARNQQSLSLQLQQLALSKVDRAVYDLQIRELERDRDEQDGRIAALERQRDEDRNRRWVTIWAPIIVGGVVAVIGVLAALAIPHIFR